MLKKAGKAEPGDLLTPEEEIKDPFVLEFLGLRDAYSESDLEEALILHLEAFLLELAVRIAAVSAGLIHERSSFIIVRNEPTSPREADRLRRSSCQLPGRRPASMVVLVGSQTRPR
jgi:YhcG PDDEXK nuclease domain